MFNGLRRKISEKIGKKTTSRQKDRDDRSTVEERLSLIKNIGPDAPVSVKTKENLATDDLNSLFLEINEKVVNLKEIFKEIKDVS